MKDADPFRLLVICTGNRARSQIAHGWPQSIGGDGIAVSSAGIEPKTVHPIATRVMAEVGIDISTHTSDHVGQYLNDEFELVLTVCDAAREACPLFPGAKRTLHQAFEDPGYPWMREAEMTNVFRGICDAIGAFSRELLASELA